MNRRQAIARLGLGAAGVWLRPPALLAGPEVPTDRLTDLARRIRETPRREILALAADAIGRGAGPRNLLGATFLAGVHDVQPRPVGNNLHSVMTVEASYRLVEMATSPKEAWLVALWNLDAFKATQRERGEDWVLPPAPQVAFTSEAAARRELITALDTWDEARADRAIVGLLPYLDRKSLYEILWPYSARCMAYLGHKIVYGAMTEAVLRRIDWRYAEPVARSLVYGLVGQGREGPLIRAYEHAVTVEASFPEGWLARQGTDPKTSVAVLRSLLTGDYKNAHNTMIQAARDGASAQTLWDAARLGAAELWLRRKSNDPESGEAIRAVHAVTEVWSLSHAWRATRSARNRHLLLLQAASWVPEMRDMLLARDAIAMQGPGIENLGEGVKEPPGSLDELFQDGDPGAARAFLERYPQQAAGFRQRLRRHLAAKGAEYHQFKYAVALVDETAPAHPRWTARLLAPAVGYMPTHRTRDNELTESSLHALRQAGAI
ncbi:MAG: hypothetical protein AAF657_07335 [Acidobacteriota bacterium]